jgi:hypothetical protein
MIVRGAQSARRSQLSGYQRQLSENRSVFRWRPHTLTELHGRYTGGKLGGLEDGLGSPCGSHSALPQRRPVLLGCAYLKEAVGIGGRVGRCSCQSRDGEGDEGLWEHLCLLKNKVWVYRQASQAAAQGWDYGAAVPVCTEQQRPQMLVVRAQKKRGGPSASLVHDLSAFRGMAASKAPDASAASAARM